MRKTSTGRALRGAGLVLGLIALAAGPAAAQGQILRAWDFGGTVDSTTSVTDGGTADWLHKDKAALWASADLGAALTLDAQGSYTYDLDRPYLFDLDRLQLKGSYVLGGGGLLGFSAGRFRLRDSTGDVLSLSADGLEVSYGLPALQVSLGAAYTGLLLKPVAGLSLSAADAADEADDDVVLAPKRLLALAELRLPELFALQTVTLAALVQQDLRAEENERLHSQYLTAGLGGPIVPGLFWNASFTLSTRQDEAAGGDTELSWLAEGGARWFAPQLLSTRAALDLIWSSGDEGGSVPFLPVTPPTLGVVITPSLGDLVRVQGSWSLKPLARSASLAMRNLQTELRGTAFLLSSGMEYQGTEVLAVVNFRPLSDLGASLSGGVYLPESGDPRYGGKLEVSLAF